MQCPRCQHENAVGQNFCHECGARLASVCFSCEMPDPPSERQDRSEAVVVQSPDSLGARRR